MIWAIYVATTWKTKDFADPVVAEAVTMYKAMYLAISRCFRKVIFECDYESLIRCFPIKGNSNKLLRKLDRKGYTTQQLL